MLDERKLYMFNVMFNAYLDLAEESKFEDLCDSIERLVSLDFELRELYYLLVDRMVSDKDSEEEKIRKKIMIVHDLAVGSSEEYNDGECCDFLLEMMERIATEGKDGIQE